MSFPDNDTLKAQLVQSGYTGPLNDALVAYLRNLYSFSDRSYNDLLYYHLGLQGYTGAISDRVYSWDGTLWTPAVLFSSGELGFILDPSDFSTMFQDAAGTIPVTAVGQPVGKILDKSGNENHATQVTDGKRPLLQQDGSGYYYLDFDGVDDFLVTPSINFTGTDDFSLVAAATMDNTTIGTVFSTAVYGTNGAIEILANSGAINTWFMTARASSNAYIRPVNDGTAPSTNILTIIADSTYDVAMQELLCAVDGQFYSTNQTGTDIGAGNFQNLPIYLGIRPGLTSPFNGRIYGVFFRSTKGQKADKGLVEEYLTGKCGVSAEGGFIKPLTTAEIDYGATNYDGYGLCVETSTGDVMYFGRRGTSHIGASSLYKWKYSQASRTWSPAVHFHDNATYTDDRGMGGGKTSSGTILLFNVGYDGVSLWSNPEVLRSVDDGVTWATIALSKPFGMTKAAAYGPIVELPSGKLMQTMFGDNGAGIYTVYVTYSSDDGLTWGSEVALYSGATYFNETAAAYISGATDGTSKIVAVVRNESANAKNHQFTSSDGGATWTNNGEIACLYINGGLPVASEASPWVVVDGIYLYLVTATRSQGILRYFKVVAADVHTSVLNWPAVTDSSVIEVSAAPRGENEFGYPSFFKHTSGKVVLCYSDPDPSTLAVPTIWSNAVNVL